MSVDLAALSWPAGKLGEAIEALASAGGLEPRVGPSPVPTGVDLGDDAAIAGFIEHAAAELGVEAEPVGAAYGQLLETIGRIGPALVRVPGAPATFLALRSGGSDALILGPDLALHRVPRAAIERLLGGAVEAPLLPEIDALLEGAGVRGRRLGEARRALLRERLGGQILGGIWLLRIPPSAGFVRQILDAGLHRRAALLLGGHAVAYALLLLAWWAAGRAVLEDRLDRGWLFAWALLLLTIVPFRLLSIRAAGLFSIDAGGLLKQRLLAGALALAPEKVRTEGAGRLLGRVMESDAIESLALNGGMMGATGVLELVVAGLVLAQGAAGGAHALLLIAWTGLAVALGVGYFRRRSRWTDARLGMTHDLVERMVGHRTRLAQEPRDAWHDGEDEGLGHYLDAGKALDRSNLFLLAIPRGWVLVGVLGLVPALVGGLTAPAPMAVALGGILLAHAALQRVVFGIAALSGAAIAWRQVAHLFHAAADVAPTPPLPPPRLPVEDREASRVILEAHDIVFRHRALSSPVVRGASLRIGARDRVLLEGPSGGGKSTLSALLAGLREPQEGLLLLDGLDRATLGAAAWRRRVAAAPQFHENHVLTGSFAFNLLMGRRWPPTLADLQEAEAVCRELGLGELLDRMPAGFEQMVGETGWQLSHGEKSRLYMARALLQGGEIVVLDESFAALDPETLKQALECVIARAPALVVVAHP